MKSNPLELWSRKKLQVIDSVKSGKTNLVRVFRDKPLSILDHEFIEYCESSCPEVILAPKNEKLYGVISITFSSKNEARNELLKFIRAYEFNSYLNPYSKSAKLEKNKIMYSESLIKVMMKALEVGIQDPEFSHLDPVIFGLIINKAFGVYYKNDKIPTSFSVEEYKCIMSSVLDYLGYSIDWKLVDFRI